MKWLPKEAELTAKCQGVRLYMTLNSNSLTFLAEALIKRMTLKMNVFLYYCFCVPIFLYILPHSEYPCDVVEVAIKAVFSKIYIPI